MALPTYQEHTTLPEHKPYVLGTNPKPGDLPNWSGREPVPAIGSRVSVKINGIGEATVLAYFTEHGFLGLHVLCHKCPAWMQKQNGHSKCHVFGNEIEG